MKNKHRFFNLIFEALLFYLCSYSFVSFLASVGNLIGSTLSPLSRLFPYYLSVILDIYFLFVWHLVNFPKNEKKLQLTLKVNGIILAALFLLAAILILVKVLTKEYASFLIGGPIQYFPLVYFILDLLFGCVGVLFALYGFFMPADPATIYFPAEQGKARQAVSSIFRSLFVLVALYLGGILYEEITIANYGSSTWWCMLSLVLLMSLPIAYLFYYVFFYKNGQEKPLEKRKLISLCSLGAALIFEVYFLVCLLLRRNFIVEDATNLFIVDFMKGWNLAPYLVSLMAILPPAIAYFSFAIEGKKKAKSPQKAPEIIK
jgi:hypothetical protein